MLHRLRWRLVLLNAAISGAILLTMALVSLRVSENRICTQYENELARNSQLALSALAGADSDIDAEMSGASAPDWDRSDAADTAPIRRMLPVRVFLPSDYIIYMERGGQKQILNTGGGDAEAMRALTERARALVAGEIDELVSGMATPGLEAVRIDNVVPNAFFFQQRMPGGAATPLTSAVMITSALRPMMVTSDDGKQYRVAASRAGTFSRSVGTSGTSGTSGSTGVADAGTLLLVLQDRGAELNAIASMRLLFLSCALGGLLLVVLASLYLSARSIRPVEQSIRLQREFVAAASHELRTPVASVRANADVLRDAELGDFAPYLASIALESERMSHLVADLMLLARGDAGELTLDCQPVDALELARQAVSAIAPLAAQKHIEMTTRLAPAVFAGDCERVRQALLAILDNAVRYTDEGGHILVETGLSGAHAWLRVSDEGIGIPDEHKPRVFDRFYRVDAARARGEGGSGLGLSVARELTERMRGSISLRDSAGGGCAFELRFRAEK